MGDEHSRRPRRKFSDEFKRHAVALVVDAGWPITEVADELGLYGSTLGNWVRQHREREQDG